MVSNNTSALSVLTFTDFVPFVFVFIVTKYPYDET